MTKTLKCPYCAPGKHATCEHCKGSGVLFSNDPTLSKPAKNLVLVFGKVSANE